MFDVNDDAKGEYRRIEVLTGPGRRRRWSADQKARIVAEALVPGARVSEVARRWQICSQQVYGWRRTMRQDLASAAGITATPGFVPIVSEAVPAGATRGVWAAGDRGRARRCSGSGLVRHGGCRPIDRGVARGARVGLPI